MAYGNYAPFYRMGYLNPMQPPIQAPIDNQNMYYQPPMAQPMPTAPTPEKSITNDFIWVLNENEATSYPVAPNNTVTLWDKNLPKIYIKSVNGQGVPSMRRLKYIECNENAEKQPTEGFNGKGNNQPTLDGINALNGKFDNILSEFSTLKDKINDLSAKPAPSPTKNNKKSEE